MIEILCSMKVIGCIRWCLLLKDGSAILNYSPSLFCTKMQIKMNFVGFVILFVLHNAFIILTAMLMYARYAKITLQTTFLANNIKLTDTDCFVDNKLRSCKFLGRLNIVCVILYLVITFIALKNNGICFAE